MQQASLFYGGQIYGNLGAFVQGTYDKASQHTYLDNTDIRYADTTQIGGIDVLYGLDVNNGPTVQDVWNTTPAWGFPYVASTLAPAFAPPGTQIESGFGGRSVGTGAYVFLKDMLYLEGSAYNNLSKGELNVLGQPCANNSDYVQNVQAWAAQNYPPNQPYSIACPSNSLASASPYWRVALEPSWGDHTLMIGAFGFYPQVLPGRVMGYGVNSYRDIGFDAQYQYINDVHALTLKVSRISETQNLQATFAQGVAGQAINALGIVNAFGLPPLTGNASSNPTNSLTSFKASAAYVWDHTISGTVGYFSVRGTADGTLYGNALLGLSGPSAYGSPDGKGLIFDIAYCPSARVVRASIRGPTPRSACPTRITFSSMAGRPISTGSEPITTAAAGARTRRPTTTRCSSIPGSRSKHRPAPRSKSRRRRAQNGTPSSVPMRPST